MAQNFGTLLFTPPVRAVQERYGGRRLQYQSADGQAPGPDRLTPDEAAFIAERDSFYMASTGSTGWPYVQHRGGSKGFLKVIDPQTLAFADFRGNRQFITTGNVTADNRVALIMVDYPHQARLKILGRAEVFEGEKAREWLDRVRTPGHKGTIDRVFLIHVEGFDWNCPQHITPRFTADQIREAILPMERRIKELEEENRRLREDREDEGRGKNRDTAA